MDVGPFVASLQINMSGSKLQYPPELSSGDEEETLIACQHWALSHGLCMLDDGKVLSKTSHAPFTLFPTPFPKTAFEEALNVQTAFNELYARVSSNAEWLENVISELAEFDPEFTGRLFKIHRQVKNSAGPQQPLTAGLFRSDYITTDKNKIKQVEFNTVSVSFGPLSSKVSELHNYLISNGIYGIEYPIESVPVSPALKELAKSLAQAHDAYVETSLSDAESPASILMIVQPNERNIFDQKLLEYELSSTHDIFTHRVTLSDVQEKTCLIEENRLVHQASGDEISVVYYRSGYSPGDYMSDKEWENRLFLEYSYAIKCPSVTTQLAGTKKVQQLLTERAVINKLAPKISKSSVDALLETFVAIHPLDDETPEGRHARTLAFDHPEYYVLKPQREGGGNNIYKENIPGFLTSTPKQNWAAYILMELIHPPQIKNKILRNGTPHLGEIVSELGVFGGILWNSQTGECKFNKQDGWLLRTKLQSSDEGGVAAGFGCIDAVYLL